MKKNLKKLTLNRETLRQLTNDEVKTADGGVSGNTSCRCKERSDCACETLGC